jgi:hypothetical protein
VRKRKQEVSFPENMVAKSGPQHSVAEKDLRHIEKAVAHLFEQDVFG